MDRAPDEGAMSIRLDPRRVSTLKQLPADAGVRPGDLVRQWVEERVDAARGGSALPAAAAGLAERMSDLAARVEALEAAAGLAAPTAAPARDGEPAVTSAATEQDTSAAEPMAEPGGEPAETGSTGPKRQRRNAISAAAPPGSRVALHDEMIEVLREHGPLTAAELAGAIAERGRYAPPRSGKPLDAAMVSQRVSNPTYRSRFVRQDGRIGLAE
jgi:hypothetical protein